MKERTLQAIMLLIALFFLVTGGWMCLDTFMSKQNTFPISLLEMRAAETARIWKFMFGMAGLLIGGVGLYTFLCGSRRPKKKAWTTFRRRFALWMERVKRTGLLGNSSHKRRQRSQEARSLVIVQPFGPSVPEKRADLSPPLIASPHSKNPQGREGEDRKKEIGEEWRRLVAEISALHSGQPDPNRKKQLEDIESKLASSSAHRIETARWWLSKARLISSTLPEKQDRATDSHDLFSPITEQLILALLPIDDIVRAKRPDIDPDDVKRLLSVLIAPGSDHPHFGDNTIAYAELYKNALGKGMSPSAFETCFAWLASNAMPVIVDIETAAIRRRRGRGNSRCVLNTKHKDVPPPGNEIIKIIIRARQQLVRLSKRRN